MTDITIHVALKKFSVGDGITDEELDLLIALFTTAVSSLYILTFHFKQEYGFSYQDARNNLALLEVFKENRKTS